jgi:hypothetical protein
MSSQAVLLLLNIRANKVVHKICLFHCADRFARPRSGPFYAHQQVAVVLPYLYPCGYNALQKQLKKRAAPLKVGPPQVGGGFLAGDLAKNPTTNNQRYILTTIATPSSLDLSSSNATSVASWSVSMAKIFASRACKTS